MYLLTTDQKSDLTMSESVSIDTIKMLFNAHGETLQGLSAEIKSINQEQKSINIGIQQVISLLRDDINTTKAVLDQHIKEYDKSTKTDDIRFKNLFKRQDAIDKILIERAPLWVVFRSFGRAITIFVSALIIGAASALGGIWYNR